MEHDTKLTVVLFCPATGGAEQDGSGGDEVQASPEALRRKARQSPQQYKDPGGKPGRQRAGASGGACVCFLNQLWKMKQSVFFLEVWFW